MREKDGASTLHSSTSLRTPLLVGSANEDSRYASRPTTALFSATEFTLFVLIGNVLFRLAVALSSHSGMGKPPLYGDYEAQRHWLEITLHTPVAEWYRATPDNDLLYWGLDYPPLTAYHSWLLGVLANAYDPRMVALHTSRGYEDDSSKAFMRNSVVIGDLLIFIPALYSFSRLFKRGEEWKGLVVLGLQPALLLIDHGHFQYNGIALGLALWGFVAVAMKQYFVGSMFLIWSVHFKIMGVYYLPVVFFHILGAAWKHDFYWQRMSIIFKAAAGVVFGLVSAWGPYLFYSGNILDALHRMFPVARGLFEDKVANFWCALDPLLKTRSHLAVENQVLLCGLLTIMSIIPSCVHVFRKPSATSLFLSLSASSLSFFMFSFHVHEKTILYPLLPITLLFLHGDKRIPCWIVNSSLFTLFPLLYKDGLLIPFIAVIVLYNMAFFRVYDNTPHEFFAIWHQVSVFLSVGMCFCHVYITPPQRYPDLFPYLIAAFGFLNNFLYWAVLHLTMLGLLQSRAQLKLQSF
eukprot:TRINITY_DN17405_c0_g1_i1.p1 TRINITY_DN17405_c0_g1~~TRINITY_DN17405_c0_g1_i1.p1  ORF type:complete len:520 (+),score=80.51 TRINITY_DN17405_c0_g1_i1:48-1607(+)